MSGLVLFLLLLVCGIALIVAACKFMDTETRKASLFGKVVLILLGVSLILLGGFGVFTALI